MTIWVAITLIAAGVAVGMLSGFFGVGGGILIVPIIVLGLDRSQHLAEGTSLLVIVPTAIAGVLGHHRRGLVAFRIAALLAMGGIAGAFIGALLALGLPGGTLRVIFAVLVALTGVRLILDASRPKGPQIRKPPKPEGSSGLQSEP